MHTWSRAKLGKFDPTYFNRYTFFYDKKKQLESVNMEYVSFCTYP